MADYIPFEIQAEIMKRLPIKSLMQFRSVSKQWKSLIDSSEFIGDYSFNHTHQQHLLVRYLVSQSSEEKYASFVDDDTFPQTKFSLPAPISAGCNRLVILGSSHGLFCFYRLHENVDVRMIKRVVVWNPSVRKSVVIDLYRFTRVPSENVIMIKRVVVWNPSVRKSVVIDLPVVTDLDTWLHIGFGVCPQTRDPKLVKTNFNAGISPCKFEVYTLSSRVWRNIPAINQFHESINLDYEQVVIDGFIYWLAYDHSGTVFRRLIVSFDITNEKFMEISLPNTLACSDYDCVICTVKESLAMVEMVVEDEEKQSYYDVWMMEAGVPNTFTKLFTINSPEAEASLLGFRKNYDQPIFRMTRGDSDTDDLVVSEVNSEDINYIGISWKGICARSYMETLLLLDY